MLGELRFFSLQKSIRIKLILSAKNMASWLHHTTDISPPSSRVQKWPRPLSAQKSSAGQDPADLVCVSLHGSQIVLWPFLLSNETNFRLTKWGLRKGTHIPVGRGVAQWWRFDSVQSLALPTNSSQKVVLEKSMVWHLESCCLFEETILVEMCENKLPVRNGTEGTTDMTMPVKAWRPEFPRVPHGDCNSPKCLTFERIISQTCGNCEEEKAMKEDVSLCSCFDNWSGSRQCCEGSCHHQQHTLCIQTKTFLVHTLNKSQILSLHPNKAIH